MKGWNGAGFYRWRWGFCLAGAVVGLLVYACRAGGLPRRSPLGVEQRLFGVELVPVKLLEAPNGGRWILTVDSTGSPPPTAPGSVVLPALFADSRPLLAAGQEGTWLLDGSSLRRVWRYPARGWADELHLWTDAPHSVGYPPDTLLLSLQAGRSRRVRGRPPGLNAVDDLEDTAVPLAATDVFSEPLAEDPVLRAALATGAIVWFDVGAGRVGLVASEDGTSPIYGVSDDAAPRTLLLCPRGIPLNLSRDGRRLFVFRDAALWRFDFTEPLPALLRRQPIPTPPLPGGFESEDLAEPRTGAGGRASTSPGSE